MWTKLAAVALALATSGCAGQVAGVRSVARTSPAVRDTRLFLAGDGELTVVNVRTRAMHVVHWRQLAPGDPPYRIVRRGGWLVFYGRDTYAAPVDLAVPPRRIGSSWFFVPSAIADRVWLAILDPDSPPTKRRLAGIREVTTGGRATTPSVRPPGGRWPLAAVREGLLFEDRDGGMELWSPTTRRVVLRLPSPFVTATRASSIAWCDDRWRLHLTDAASGSTRLIPLPQGFSGFDCFRTGAFAPDGSSLAVTLVTRRAPDASRQLGIVDLETGTAVAIPGSRVAAGYVFVTWSSSGDQVFLTGGKGIGGEHVAKRQIVVYRIGERAAEPLPVQVDAFYGIAAS